MSACYKKVVYVISDDYSETRSIRKHTEVLRNALHYEYLVFGFKISCTKSAIVHLACPLGYL